MTRTAAATHPRVRGVVVRTIPPARVGADWAQPFLHVPPHPFDTEQRGHYRRVLDQRRRARYRNDGSYAQHMRRWARTQLHNQTHGVDRAWYDHVLQGLQPSARTQCVTRDLEQRSDAHALASALADHITRGPADLEHESPPSIRQLLERVNTLAAAPGAPNPA